MRWFGDLQPAARDARLFLVAYAIVKCEESLPGNYGYLKFGRGWSQPVLHRVLSRLTERAIVYLGADCRDEGDKPLD